MTMSYERMVTAVADRSGLADRALAEKAIEATLVVLGCRIPPADLRAATQDLPQALADYLWRCPGDHEYDLEEFYRRVSFFEDVQQAFGMEHAQVVLQVLAEAVPDRALAHLKVSLPEPLAELINPRGAHGLGKLPRPGRPPGVLPHHLSDGRPGGQTPLSEAAPRGHVHSIARSDNPHGDTKLSSGRDAKKT